MKGQKRMISTYDEARSWIHGRLQFGIKPGLERMSWMLEKLGSPHKHLKAIHIAGTNGKGSTLSYLREMLCAGGYTVGTFTSPYIETFNERISVNGKPIRDEELVHLVNEVKDVVESLNETNFGEATEFEVITVMAFYYFGKVNKQDFVIFETGLGGRLDSTNVVNPIATIITNIGFDHMNILGSTIEEIAGEKAGIIKRNIPLFTAVEQKGALDVIQQKAKVEHAPVYMLERDFCTSSLEAEESSERFQFSGFDIVLSNVKLSMLGAHQVKNAALALAALLYLKQAGLLNIEVNKIYEGLKRTAWLGRFEQISQNPLIFLDGAHNIQGIESLVSTVKRHYKEYNVHVVFSCLKDKEATELVTRLEEIATSIIFTTFDFPRADNPEHVAAVSQHSSKVIEMDFKKAIEKGKQNLTKEKDLLLITGSLYFISEVRNYLLS
jgi:dihydrofolate synthase/folylpolyglutamate synthase